MRQWTLFLQNRSLLCLQKQESGLLLFDNPGLLPGLIFCHHHRNQGDAVADAMMDPKHQGTAALVAVDEMELPQRVLRIQRRVRQRAHQHVPADS